jgi:protein-S-isoprenylcysteine O-methyltransferase Ste14
LFKFWAYGLWLVFLISWWSAARWTGKATVRASDRIGALYLLGFFIGFALLFSPPQETLFGHVRLRSLAPGRWAVSLWQDPAWTGWALVTLELAAFAFAWWARLHLGRLWSGMLTLREGHRVVDTGPYRLVRHPIYTGFIGGSWAYALALASPATLAGAAVLTAVMSVKSKTEESFLRRELGTEAYDAYAARTPMLIPFGPR